VIYATALYRQRHCAKLAKLKLWSFWSNRFCMGMLAEEVTKISWLAGYLRPMRQNG
jgi:hypothetical protein